MMGFPDDDLGDVRVIRGEAVQHLPQHLPPADPWDKHTHEALTEAEKAAEIAYDKVREAIGWLRSVEPAIKSGEAPRYVHKLMEEIADVRRLRLPPGGERR